MKFVLFCTTSLFVLLLSSASQADKILLLGDSLSAAYRIPWESGWAQLLAEDIETDHQLINASVSGETTGGGLARLPALLEQHQPDWVIVELGGNDGLQGYPLNLIRDNLAKLAVIITQGGAKPIYFGIQIPPNYGKRYNDAFTALYLEVAQQFQAPYLNFFVEDIATNSEFIQSDGIHPTQLAQALIRDHVKTFLLPLFDPVDT